ncbi:MAG TPA: RNA polymerase sigma factor [Bryobacteraceae bacterium]|nr:RNA polymerase sigma factor [Bryobacteraceae bacterium]
MKIEDAFDRYHEAVFDFAYRLTRSSDLAEDITQECFLALVRAPQRFDPERGTLRAYLFAIVRNLALKNYRDQRPAEPTESHELELSADPRPVLEISSAVGDAVAELPHLQQEALILFQYEGLALEEIAQVLGTDVGTVKSRLHRARERLRRELAPYRNVGGIHGTV